MATILADPPAAPPADSATATAGRDHAQELLVLRSVIMAGEIVAIVLAMLLLDLTVPLAAAGLFVGCQGALNAHVWRNLKRGRRMTARELSAQLIADIVILTAVLYFAGDTSNPFTDLFFVPLAFGAATLPWRYTLATTVAAITGHSLLEIAGETTIVPHSGPKHDLWQIGITVTDVLTATMITFVVFQVAARLRHHQHLLSRERERALNDRRLVELGAMATGAAHELGSPLSTMAVLATELRRSYAHLPQLCDDLRIMSTQIEACKESLSRMLTSAGQARAEGGGRVAIDAFLGRVFDRWQRLRPGIAVHLSCDGPQPAPEILADLALEQALLNLLNNAADATPSQLDVAVRWTGEQLTLRIDDDGHGLAPDDLAQLGRPFFTTKKPGEGNGLGLFLTATTVERLGGRFSLGPRPEGGARAEVVLPLARIAVDPLPENAS